MFRYFPPKQNLHPHNKRDYYIAAFTFFCVAVCLITDADASLEKQHLLGGAGWLILAGWLHGENKEIRVQVLIAVLFATIGEHFASPFMEGYIYRFHNVPAYVSPGHGMVYLTAVALGRSGFFVRHARHIALFVVIACGLWSLWGITLATRRDAFGAVLFCVFLLYLFKGKSPLVYLAAFFITTWLEVIGTAVGTWHWSVIDPVSGFTQGNPPSGVAAWYCLVDAIAMGGSAPILRMAKQTKHFLLLKLS
jgi:hypothetical protein